MTGTKQIYLVVGVPCAGKSWVCEQLGALYSYVRHDDYKDTNKYIAAIVGAAAASSKPLLIETPFSMSQLVEPLESHDYKVTPVFIIEDSDTLRQRYKARERKDIPAGHLTRQETYTRRGEELRAFRGPSEAVLHHLQHLRPMEPPRSEGGQAFEDWKAEQDTTREEWPWQT